MIYSNKTEGAFVYPWAKWFWEISAPKLLVIGWGFPISMKADPTGLLSGKSLLSGSANGRVNFNATQIVLLKVLGQLDCFFIYFFFFLLNGFSALLCANPIWTFLTSMSCNTLSCSGAFCSSCFGWQIIYKFKKHVISLKSLYGRSFPPMQMAPLVCFSPHLPCPNIRGFTVIKWFLLLSSKNKDAESKTKYINRSCHTAGRIFR